MVSNRKKNKNGTFKNIKGCQIAKRKKKTKKKGTTVRRPQCSSLPSCCRGSCCRLSLPFVVLLVAVMLLGAGAGRCFARSCGCWSLLRRVVLLPVVAAGSGGCWVWVLVRCCSVSVRDCCTFQNILSGRIGSGQPNTYHKKNKKGRYSAFPAIPP